MSNLSAAFASGKAFIPFVVAGDPTTSATVANILALARGGADIIEIGIPFSDPVADGPVIQDADLRAFAGGITTEKVFEIVAAARKETDVPFVFLTYFNIPFQYGFAKFTARCHELGVDGLVIPDLPYEEQDDFLPLARQNGVDLINLITLTSKQRIEKLAKRSAGFIYVVSSMGVTGVREEFDAHLQTVIEQIRSFTDTPTAIGFGIHSPEQAGAMAQFSDGVIVGSAIVNIIAKHGPDAAPFLEQFVKDMKAAL